MSDISNSAINYHAYNVHEDEKALSQATKIICILLPRGLMVAGFNHQGDLQMIRYGDYNKTLPAWINDFFEHRFMDEPLLKNQNNVIATFIASEKSLIIPEELFEETEARKWMEKVFFIEANEEITIHKISDESVRYLYAYSNTLKSIIGRHFTHSKILPLAACLVNKSISQEVYLNCFITGEHIYAILFKGLQLIWHQVFPYETSEDIAFHLKLLCKEQNINSDLVNVQCSVMYRGLNPVLNGLSQYFPEMKISGQDLVVEDTEWISTISLLQQLYLCAL